mgnify:CR=1 FL=1
MSPGGLPFLPESFPSLTYIALLTLVISASLFDLKYKRIPNPLTLSGAILGLAINGLTLWPDGILQSLLGFAIGFSLFLPGYLLGMTGGGDLKLMAAVGSLLGPKLAFLAFVLYILAALIWVLVYVVYAWARLGAELPFSRYWLMLRTLLRTGQLAYLKPKATEVMGQRLPMAPAIACGALAAPLLFAA